MGVRDAPLRLPVREPVARGRRTPGCHQQLRPWQPVGAVLLPGDHRQHVDVHSSAFDRLLERAGRFGGNFVVFYYFLNIDALCFCLCTPKVFGKK